MLRQIARKATSAASTSASASTSLAGRVSAGTRRSVSTDAESTKHASHGTAPTQSSYTQATTSISAASRSGVTSVSSRAKIFRTQPHRTKTTTTTAPPSVNAELHHRNHHPKPTASEPADTASLLRVSTLPNGVRVASDGTPGHFVAAGVYVGAGSRFEHEGNAGSSYLIDRLAFKSTKFRTAEQMTTEIETLGGQFIASTSREVILYQASSYTHSLPSVMSLLSDTVLNPLITPEELDAQRQSAEWELTEIHNKPDMILPELLYEVAFRKNTLGNPLLISSNRLETIDIDTIRDFRRQWFRPDRIVVAGAGVPHEQLLELAEKHFGQIQVPQQEAINLPSSTTTSSNSPRSSVLSHLLHPNAPSSSSSASKQRGRAPYATVSSTLHPNLPSYEELAEARPVYTGGSQYDDSRASNMEFSHLYIGYEGLSVHDPDIYALATLQMLLGGGSAFSAGGPGKGMFSKLYTHLLNRYHDIEHCSAFHHCYIDSGLFAICMTVNPHFIHRAPVLIAEMLDSCMLGPGSRRGLNTTELERAKNQLKSSLVMALESRMVQAEDLGRQVLAHGHKVAVEVMLDRIDAVNLQDLTRVARRVFRPNQSPEALQSGEYRSGEPTILAAGKLDGIPDVRDVLRRYGLTPS